MARLNHMALNVSSVDVVKDWYVSALGLEVEFDAEQAVGLKDDGDFTLILAQTDGPPSTCNLYFQVDDVSSAHAELVAHGLTFLHGPQDNDWGFGAGLLDPDGRFVGLWDEVSMAAHTTSASETSEESATAPIEEEGKA
jgi:predicted enzyme related to lactoylglutathione lyase